MTNEQITTLVLHDSAGSYYLVPQETVERGRVPAEHTATVERLVAETNDVSGHATFMGGVIVAITVRAAFDLGYGLTKWYLDQVESMPAPADLSGTGSGEPLPLPGGGHGSF